MGWVVLLEKMATTWIWRGWLGTRRAAKSTRSWEFRTWILLVDGRALLAGNDEAKSHSSSSAGAACACGTGAGGPARSSSEEDEGAGRLCGGWKGLEDALGLAETSDAKGSVGGGVAVCLLYTSDAADEMD